MKRLSLLIITVLAFVAIATGQTPQYYSSGGSTANSFPFNTSSSNKVQWIFVPSDFPGVVTGTITKVYFKSGTTGTNKHFTNLTIKLGYTSSTNTASGPFFTGLTTVFSASSYTIPSVTSNGWVQFTLTTPFPYNTSQNLVVEASQTGYTSGFTVIQNYVGGNKRIYGNVASSTGTGNTGLVNFGFDLLTCPNPVLSAQPADQHICEGNGTTFQVAATNASFYQWQVNTGSGFSNISNGGVYSGTTSNTLSLSNVPLSFNNQQYRCVVTGACLNPVNSDTATLTLIPSVSIASQTIADTACLDGTASIHISATGPVTGYQWQMAVATVGIYSNVPAQFPFSGTTSDMLDIALVPNSLSGYIFRCIASSASCGNATSDPIPLEVITSPKITTQPVNDTVNLGLDGEFNVAVTGKDYIYYWQASTDGINFSNINNNALYQNVHTGNLQIVGPTLSQTGWWFRCIIKSTNSNCNTYHDTSKAAQLVLRMPGDPSSVSTIRDQKGIYVSPNPVSGGQLFIHTGSELVNGTATIIDNMGRVVFTGIINTQNNLAAIPADQLPPGIYTLRLYNSGHTVFNTARFVRQ